MSSLSAKDRVSSCQFTFSDGRRCRTPRTAKNPHFCFEHAQKEARANAAESLSKDLDYLFSADYLSACDLAALGRLLPAVIRGDVKPRTARTVAYLAQTLLQTIHLAKHEYINAFGTDGWRNSIRNSVNDNYDYRFPPAPETYQPESPQPQSAPSVARTPQPAASTTNMPPPIPATQPAPSVARTPQPAATAAPPLVPVNPPQPPSSPRQSGPSRDTPWWGFGRAIPPDSHLL